MEVLVCAVLLYVIVVLWKALTRTRRAAVAVTALAVGSTILYTNANNHLERHFRTLSRPEWYSRSSPAEDEAFLTKVRSLTASDGLPLPMTTKGNAVFNDICLIAASAMEEAGGDIGTQACYAATVIKVIMTQYGSNCFDDASSAEDFNR